MAGAISLAAAAAIVVQLRASLGADSVDPPSTIPELIERADEIRGLRALLVQRDGELLVDAYFDGTERNQLHHLRSATKSVTSLLIGIAIDRGHLESTEQTLGELLGPEVRALGPEKASLTLYDLLTMTAGLDWPESDDVDWYNRLHRTSTPAMLYLERPRVAAPGERWNYSSGASHVLSAVLTEATGMKASEFARHHLFEPLGIERFRWDTLGDGHSNGGAGLELRAEDSLKLGELMLADGNWHGRQIVSSRWIEASTRQELQGSQEAPYSLHWWVSTVEGKEIWMARGYAGQNIAIVPELDLVMVTHCRWRNIGRSPVEQQQELGRFLENSLAPLVMNG